MLIDKKCKMCHAIFKADTREVKRGNAKFCNLSCFRKYQNLQTPLKKCTCLQCKTTFKSRSTQAKYCSKSCKYKHYRQLMSTAEYCTRKLQNFLLELPCANCLWNIGPRDVHHILPVSKGGVNEPSNLITLCPNCHRLAHRDLLSKDKLLELVNLRTISSPCETLTVSDALAGN